MEYRSINNTVNLENSIESGSLLRLIYIKYEEHRILTVYNYDLNEMKGKEISAGLTNWFV